MNSRLGGNWKLELGLEGWNKPGITFGENESGEVPSLASLYRKNLEFNFLIRYGKIENSTEEVSSKNQSNESKLLPSSMHNRKGKHLIFL